MSRRAVITGVGVVAPGGIGRESFWQMLTEGRTATRTITLFDPSGYRSRIAAECDFDARAAGLSAQQIRRMDRAAQFATVAAREAVADAGLRLDGVEPQRLTVSVGSAVGCTMGLEQEYAVLSDDGRRWLVDADYRVPQLYGYMVPSTIAVEIAREVAAEGPVALISTGCTSGIDAVGHAVQLITEGSADIAVTGASDAPLSPITSACFDAIKATSPNNNDPEHASRPFDAQRDGFVLGEGAVHMAGGRFQLWFDGSIAETNATGMFHLSGINRGAHDYYIEWIDNKGKTLASTEKQTLYLHQASALINNN